MPVIKRTQTGRKASLMTTIRGVEQYLGNATIVIAGVPVKAKTIAQALQAQIDAMNEVDAARVALQDALNRREKQLTPVRPYLEALQHYAAHVFGEQSVEFHALGFEPRKQPQRSVETKLAAVVQSRATRKARNTMGKKQRRLAIRAIVTREQVAAAFALPGTRALPPGDPNADGSSR